MKENEHICSHCGAIFNEENLQEFEGKLYCDQCLNDITCICDCCGKRIWSDELEGDSNITLCYRCYDNHYTSCERCGRIIHYDDAHYCNDDDDIPYCSNCIEYFHSTAIKPYSYKPVPEFFGTGNLFMGVELEIDKGGEDADNAQELTDCAEGRIYCKHDGSIDEGFELVSHPMTLDYHKNEMNWQEIFDKAINMGYRSHQTSTCGLHIHCSRAAFGVGEDAQDATVGRVVYFVEKHWNELVRFSRRKQENLNRWAAKYATISNTTQETYKKAKDKRMGRYVAVNLENSSTVEFRLFRGTLCYKTFIATLQLVEQICNIATYLSDVEVEGMSWGEFVAGISKKDKPELIEYLKSKRLYINEITEESEER